MIGTSMPEWAVREAREITMDIWNKTGPILVTKDMEEIFARALIRVREKTLEEGANECRKYAHSGGVSMMRRQVAYACEARVRALKGQA